MAADSMNVDFSDRRLSVLPPDLEGCLAQTWTISPALNLALYSGKVPFVPPEEDPEADPVERHVAVANDLRGPEFKSVGLFQCSDDGARWAYIGEHPDLRSREVGGQRIFERVLHLVVDGRDAGEVGGGKYWLSAAGHGIAQQESIPHPAEPMMKLARVTLNGKPGPTLLAVRKAAWSPLGVFAYAGDLSVGGGARVFVDGEGGPTFRSVDDLLWSPDGSRLICVASEDGVRRKLFVNGKAEPDLGEPFRMTFSPDGRRFAYVAFADGGCRVVVDGEPGPRFDGCLGIEFSRDGRRAAYVAVQKGRHHVVVDHRPGKAYEDVGGPLMSRDGGLVAHSAREGGEQFVVVDGEASEPGDLVFRLAVAAAAPSAAWVIKKGRVYRLFHRGRLVKETGERIGALVLGDDGGTLAWVEGGRLHVDARPGETVDGWDDPVIAPDGRTPVYKARVDGQPCVMVGATRHGPMRALSPFVFDPSGARVAFAAQIGNEIWRKVLPLR